MRSELRLSMKDEDDDCFDFFNPDKKAVYWYEVKRWSNAMLRFMRESEKKKEKR